ncbi:hypothetical protein SAICODRAFT_113059 [Saitoella complicata NRRL Y-17804]|uniref:uncharacterized protein n=1 Tax=Saitoella complicata (strain BCRC 22490 / CBS 7301 / JCM 7358 / NBRC 10748 / NRRL Y-17804) TaxID=698492 RepID=UPI0008675D63|nr:uncharacterized protein SAICODRAFT_113059 [Saitoella complicata NRRL Y-17804]ODQ53364.1 hypothetical protein SAICODRAFT_113059 [Saitoella complicata NRRL Y-17804]
MSLGSTLSRQKRILQSLYTPAGEREYALRPQDLHYVSNNLNLLFTRPNHNMRTLSLITRDIQGPILEVRQLVP